MSDVEILKKKRKQVKATFTRFKNYFIKHKDSFNIDNVEELRLRLETIQGSLEEFNSVQSELELIAPTQSDEVERESFEREYFDTISQARSICNKLENRQTVQSEYSLAESRAQSNAENNQNQSLIKLPTIKLPIFDGQHCDWLEFRDVFKALVDENASLSEIQKFYYLRSSLGKESSQVIKSLDVSANNYEHAWRLLRERYENKKLMIHNHIHAIFEHPVISKESHRDLRILFDNVTKHLRSLESLGENTNSWDRLIIYIFTSKFDSTTRRDWESHKYENELPQISDMNNFLKERCEMLEKLEMTKLEKSFDKTKIGSKNKRVTSSFVSNSGNIICHFCAGNHAFYNCQVLLNLPVQERISQVKNKGLCQICFRPSHQTWKCKSRKCIKCNRAHNSLLHIDQNAIQSSKLTSVATVGGNESTEVKQISNDNAKVTNNSANSNTRISNFDATATNDFSAASTGITSTLTVAEQQVLLSTALVKINVRGQTFVARALLDSGSQSNFVTEKLSKKLNSPYVSINHIVKGVGQNALKIKHKINLNISSFHNNFQMMVDCLVIPKITEKLPRMSFDKSKLRLPEHLRLADPHFNVANDIDMLLGSHAFWNIICPEREVLGESLPLLQNSKLGWIIAGNVSAAALESTESFNHVVIDDDINTNELVAKFWTLEEVTNKRVSSKEDKYCEQHFLKNFKRNEDGRITVRIPFKENVTELGNSRDIALNRFYAVERRLQRNPLLKSEYVQFMNEYENLSHMSEIADLLDGCDKGYFLPHHAVIKHSSVTTKCRVVFDASCKCDNGISLNDVQYVGPPLQNDIFDILLRFRKFKFVVAADVSKMYRQILIDPNQRCYQKIFWRDDPNKKLRCFELNTVTYGTASAPYLAVRCLLQIAKENETTFPDASRVIANDFYMDDLLTGADNETELLKIQREVTELLATSGFDLRKWMCNNGECLSQFVVKEALEVKVLNIGEHENNKTLGVYWNAIVDTIQYSVRSNNGNFGEDITKRLILSTICQIYDPLGLLGPIVIIGKILMQELWKLKISWDSVVPGNIRNAWLNFQNELNQINNLRIPRLCLISDYIHIEVHGFSDSSERAYGACVYIRTFSSTYGYSSKLLCAKSRVTPLKSVSLPRSELCGAVLLANLVKRVCDSMRINFDKKYFWTDSTIVLAWINGEPTRWKTFVANRVSEIQDLSRKTDWYHIESENNPADLLSRGIKKINLADQDLWWYGPAFLLKEKTEWIPAATVLDLNLTVPETKNTSKALLCINNSNNWISNLITISSSFLKLQRIATYVLRFVNNCRFPHSKLSGSLQIKELDEALLLITKFVQMECFEREYNCLLNKKPIPVKSSILSLHPFLHEGVLRLGGRLRNAQMSFGEKHQIILPKGHRFTQLILEHEHLRMMHCGAQQLLYIVRERFWPISARNSCKRVVRNCVVCFKVKPIGNEYLMGDLPEYRVNEYLPFTNAGVDYGGPFLVKDRKGRGAKVNKFYICLFICMSTKAVHLEPVSDLSTEAFLATLKRFISRRGIPHNIYSDNGKNFIGAKNELNEFYKLLESNSEFISSELKKERVLWHFIPPRSPAFGGIWEAGIKSCKFHLKRVMGIRTFTFEEFLTVLNQIEGILNSRPISPMSSDPGDLMALTPAHFIIGRSIKALPEGELTEIPENRLSHFQKLQSIIQNFWKRWSKEYLSELQTRTKWKKNSRTLLKLGSMVMIKNEGLPSTRWQLGRVVALHPGADGVVRVVDTKTTKGLLRRSVNKLCVLPI